MYLIPALFVENISQRIERIDKSELNNILKQISETINEIKVGKMIIEKYENVTNLVLYSKYKLSNSRHIHVKTNIIKNGKKSKYLFVLQYMDN
ncbi:MAG: hypothetical protein E7Z77_01110 [Methanobrevibacter sp.]|nr:hypothetical protein [Methanobrevibacter sp.]